MIGATNSCLAKVVLNQKKFRSKEMRCGETLATIAFRTIDSVNNRAGNFGVGAASICAILTSFAFCARVWLKSPGAVGLLSKPSSARLVKGRAAQRHCVGFRFA